MLEPLLESRIIVYSVLGFVTWLFLALWWRSRKRNLLYAAGAGVALLLVFAALDLTMDTPRKQIERALAEMSAGVKAGDAKRIFRHVSEDFRWDDASMDRKTFQSYAERVLAAKYVNELTVWGVEFPKGATAKSRPVVFNAKPQGAWTGDAAYYLVKSTFVRDPDGQWRLKGFQVTNPFVNTNQPLQPPALR